MTNPMKFARAAVLLAAALLGTAAAHAAGAIAIVDGCQYVPHNVTDVQAWGADFLAFSSHKLCGPSGIGVLWGREELLKAMPPFLGGGNMKENIKKLLNVVLTAAAAKDLDISSAMKDIDLDALIDAGQFIRDALGQPNGSRVARALWSRRQG